jgi:hypothetical protein
VFEDLVDKRRAPIPAGGAPARHRRLADEMCASIRSQLHYSNFLRLSRLGPDIDAVIRPTGPAERIDVIGAKLPG